VKTTHATLSRSAPSRSRMTGPVCPTQPAKDACARRLRCVLGSTEVAEPDSRSGARRSTHLEERRVEVDAGSRQHPAFDVRSTVSRQKRREPREPSERPRLAGRERDFSSTPLKRSERSKCSPGPRRLEWRSDALSSTRAPTRTFASSTSSSSDCAGSGLDSSCLLRSDRDPSRTRAPAKGRRGVERVEVLSIGGLEFARAGRIPRLSRVGDLLDSCELKMKPRAPFQPLGSIRCRM
jgi:hypothetical protein